MLKKSMYPFFRLSSRWVDPRYFPLTRREVKRNNLQDKIPKNHFMVSNYYVYFVNGAKLLVKSMLKYGNIFSTYRGPFLFVYVFSPQGVWEVLASKQKSFRKGTLWQGVGKVLGNGLLVSEDPDHLVYRRITKPNFDHKKINKMSERMLEIVKDRTEDLAAFDKEIEVRSEMNSLTFEVISKCVFGVDANHSAELVKKNLSIAQDGANRTQGGNLSRFEKFNLPYFRKFLNSSVALYDFVNDLYEEKIKTGLEEDDLLAVYIANMNTEDQKMSKHQILDEMITVILAGFETTANTLIWSYVYLNKHPEEYDKLVQESHEIFSSNLSNEEILKRIVSSTVCSNILSETLRLCPPVYQIPRMSKEDVIIDGQFIPKNSFIVTSPYATHRNPDIFIDPEKFNPDRWNNGFEKSLPLGAYFPFGEGNRRCMGDQFAMIEMKIILLCTANKFRIKTYGRMPRGLDRVTYRVEKPLRAKIIPS